MIKLLSEEGLEIEILNILGSEGVEEAVEKLLDLIQSQKIAWGEYVIGGNFRRDNVIAEAKQNLVEQQRLRNTLPPREEHTS